MSPRDETNNRDTRYDNADHGRTRIKGRAEIPGRSETCGGLHAPLGSEFARPGKPRRFGLIRPVTTGRVLARARGPWFIRWAIASDEMIDTAKAASDSSRLAEELTPAAFPTGREAPGSFDRAMTSDERIDTDSEKLLEHPHRSIRAVSS